VGVSWALGWQKAGAAMIDPEKFTPVYIAAARMQAAQHVLSFDADVCVGLLISLKKHIASIETINSECALNAHVPDIDFDSIARSIVEMHDFLQAVADGSDIADPDVYRQARLILIREKLARDQRLN
jgi:hypothetical protein